MSMPPAPPDERSKERFVVKVPLPVTPRDEAILDQRLRTRAMLKNTALVEVVARAKQMRRDRRFREAARMSRSPKRTAAFRQLKAEYRLRPFDINETVQQHWRASKWMPHVLQSAINDALAQELHGEVSSWLVGLTGQPRPQPLREASSLWGRSTDAGLQWSEKKQALVFPRAGKNAPAASRAAYPHFNHRRKGLALKLSHRHRPGSRFWQQRIGSRRVVRVGLTRELTRRGPVWFALFTVEGRPYRNPDRARLIKAGQGRLAGVDVNVSSVAVVGQGTAERIPLITAGQLEQALVQARRQRRRQRALARSLRASNPGVYDGRGRHRRGKKIRNRSGRAHRLQAALAVEARRAALSREREQRMVAKHILVHHGTELVTEKVKVSSWRGRWGKRMALTNPARQTKILVDEALAHGGSVQELSIMLGLSSTCLCGQRLTKGLGREHVCETCGLGVEHPLDRDLFSALLARLVGQLGEQAFCAAVREGTLADAHRRLGGAPELSDRELLSLRKVRVPSPSPRKSKREVAKPPALSGTAATQAAVRALDGLPPADAGDKVVHSGSKSSLQTDGTTPGALVKAPLESSGRRRTGKQQQASSEAVLAPQALSLILAVQAPK